MDGLQWKNPINMNDLGVPLFLETPICVYWDGCIIMFLHP